MSVIVVLPDEFLASSGINRNYLLVGLLIVVTIALVYYSKFVLVGAVCTLVIGANLPDGIAQILNVDSKIFMVSLIAVLLVSVANRIFKLPTGLDKPQGIPAEHDSVARNQKNVESDLSENEQPYM